MPALPTPMGATAAPVYPQNIDNGMVAFTQDGTIHTVDWRSYLVGLAYYLPGSHAILSSLYAHAESGNIESLAKERPKSRRTLGGGREAVSSFSFLDGAGRSRPRS
jgi:hypothetical protein